MIGTEEILNAIRSLADNHRKDDEYISLIDLSQALGVAGPAVQMVKAKLECLEADGKVILNRMEPGLICGVRLK